MSSGGTYTTSCPSPRARLAPPRRPSPAHGVIRSAPASACGCVSWGLGFQSRPRAFAPVCEVTTAWCLPSQPRAARAHPTSVPALS